MVELLGLSLVRAGVFIVLFILACIHINAVVFIIVVVLLSHHRALCRDTSCHKTV